MHWKKVTLAGVGLLGGSLGLALMQRRLADRVVGLVRRKEGIRQCLQRGAVHEATLDSKKAIEGADLVVICTPLGAMSEIFEEILPWLAPGITVTDVGSVKRAVVKELEAASGRKGINFIGSHPMAGGEKMGVANARADLLQDAICVVTRTPKSNSQALRSVRTLWEDVGCRVSVMTPEAHDRIVSKTSHLPHVLAAMLAKTVLRAGRSSEVDSLCARGFRDTTRVASGSPEMWRDILLQNQDNIIEALQGYEREMKAFRKILGTSDARKLEDYFKAAKFSRDEWARRNGAMVSD